jgi:tetratricopeptide (TPR) repeat protein
MYNLALVKNPHYAPALFGMGWCLFLFKKYEQAAHCLDTLFEDTCIINKGHLSMHGIDIHGIDMLFWYLLGECSFHLNRPEKVIACFSKVRDLTKKGMDQEHTLSLTRLAWAHAMLDKEREAKTFSLEAMDAYAKMQGGNCLSHQYINPKSKLLWECKNGHQWQATSEEILGNGSWCPRCVAGKTRSETAHPNEGLSGLLAKQPAKATKCA